MDIRSALDRLIAIEGGLSITSPSMIAVKKAYKYFPPTASELPDTPAFTNTWTLVQEERAGGLRVQDYTVHMQLFVDDADQDVAADIASGFMVALVTALDGDVKLAGTVSMQTLRGGSPTLVGFERGTKRYIGLDLFLDLVLKDGVTFA